MKKFALACLTLSLPTAALAAQPQLVCEITVTTITQALPASIHDQPEKSVAETCTRTEVATFGRNENLSDQYDSAQVETDLGFVRHVRVQSIRDPKILDQIRVRAGDAEFIAKDRVLSVFTGSKASRKEVVQQFAKSDCSVTDGSATMEPSKPSCTIK